METLGPAIVGAVASALLMFLANVSNRRSKNEVEIFRRLNQLEKEVARQQNPRSRLRGL